MTLSAQRKATALSHIDRNIVARINYDVDYIFHLLFANITILREAPNGLRYPLVGGTRQRQFAGTSSKPRNMPENAATPTSRVHAVLAAAIKGRYLFA
jgi:hypothetical protein